MDADVYVAVMEAAVKKGLEFNTDRGVEIQTEKAAVKAVPCTGCGRPLIVNTFYAPSLARCSECKGDGTTSEVAAPVPGQTDPAKVADLTKVLINPHFAKALCPVHPDDEEHEMELKSVSHSDHHGPSEFVGYVQGRAQYRQLAKGETVMHQCLKCRATVSYSTTAQIQFQRENEPKVKALGTLNEMADFIGMRPEEANGDGD